MIEGALASKEEEAAAFRTALEIALRPHLPPREYSDPTVF